MVDCLFGLLVVLSLGGCILSCVICVEFVLAFRLGLLVVLDG